MINVATYNIKNKTAKKILGFNKAQLKCFYQNVKLINEANPDIIGLQEVTKEEYQWLKEVFCGKYELFGDFRGSKGFTNEACPIMIKANKGYITNYGTFSISEDINDIGRKYLGAFFPRIATYAHYVDDFNEYTFINMHVDNSSFIQKRTFNENGPIDKIMSVCDSKNQILLGDMNMSVNGVLKNFCDRNHLLDAADEIGNTYKTLNKAFDHILYNDDELQVLETKKYTNNGSDHSLIMTKIKPKRS